MKLLVLGGTIFVGRHIVEAALARGHEVTLLTRGQHNPDLFPEAEKLRGDRDGGLDALQGRTWDAVIDTCGYFPRVVRQSAELLSQAVGLYVFVSSISVYKDYSAVGMDENSPLATIPDEAVEEITGETYGALKVLCEGVVEAACPSRALIIRPGLVVGPHDKSGRFTYWPRRVAEGGDVLAPGRPEKRVQFIDARDLAEWTIRLTEAGRAGVFNAVSADPNWTMGRLLDESKAVSGSDARFRWVPDDFLLSEGVAPWSDLPLWLPDTDEWAGAAFLSAARAVSAGLTFRPLAETIRETLDWDATLDESERPSAGIRREREAELLQKFSENRLTP